MMVFIKAFVIGGIICALTQILMEKTKLMPGRIMVLLVTLGTFLGQSVYMSRLRNSLVQVRLCRC